MCRLIVLLIAFCCATVDTFGLEPRGDTASLLTVMQKQLQAEKAREELLIQRLDALKPAQRVSIEHHLITQQLLQRVNTTLVMTEAESNNLELTLKTAQLELELTQSTIQNLQRRSIDIRKHLPISPEIEATLQEQYKLLDIQQKRVRILQSTRELLSKIVAHTRDWYNKLQLQEKSAVQNQRQDSFNTLLTQLRDVQQTWIGQLGVLSDQISNQEEFSSVPQATDLLLALNAIITEEESNLIHLQLNLGTINNRLKQLSETLGQYPPLMLLNTLQKPLENIFNQLQTIEELLQKKGAFLKNCLELAVKNQKHHDASKIKQLLGNLRRLIENYEKQSTQISKLTQQAQSELNLFTKQLHAYLGNRQDLPGLDVRAWLNLIKRLAEVPTLFSNQMMNLSNLILVKVNQAPWWQSIVASFITIGWLRVLFFVKRFVKIKRAQLLSDGDQVVPVTSFSFFLKLLNKHVYSLVGCMGMGSLLLFFGVPFSTFSWILNLITVRVLFSIVIKNCYFWLVEKATEEKRARNTVLYRRLRSILSIGGMITLFSLVAHQLVLDYEVRNFVARLFMLFLLVVALVLFRIWTLVPKLLEGYWSKRRRYLKQVVRWVSFLLPMSLLLNAILGLVGYVQLAWAIIGYQGLLLVALTIYPFTKGLLNEFFNWLSEQSIRHFRNGWLWSEAFLKPLYQILKFCILISLVVLLLFSFAGWREQLFTLGTNPTVWLNKPLLVIADVPVNALKIIKLIIMGSVVVWLSRWTREFAYRWIFANLKDLGLRNSLSIFTQYMAVFMSILSVLQIAGLTLSVVKYVLSGFAIGLSFGLRDLFNNFVTGILLLVERPVKVGDWVTIGNCDGQVIHIGARSITIDTGDHQDLMVPNTDLFYKHFINWTRHDSVIRITTPLSINRNDDPFKVREIILEVIHGIPKILHNPAPEVYFTATDQVLLAFKVEYYVDLTQITSRSEVNSQFLFALWKRFCEENISRPEVVHELYLKGNLGLEDPLPNRQIKQQHA